ncbi:MAG: RNA-binding protein [Thermoplasmatota archaeon]
MAVKIKNRHRLKNKEIKDIMMQLKKRYSSSFIYENSSVEMGFLEEFKIIIIDGEIIFFIIEDSIIFTLNGLYKYKPEKYRVVVDMGAVSFVTKGADIMAPGIVSADHSIVKDDYVWVCDEKNFKPIAVGKALMSGEEMKHSQVGKAIQNLHFVGDRLWILSHE